MISCLEKKLFLDFYRTPVSCDATDYSGIMASANSVALDGADTSGSVLITLGSCDCVVCSLVNRGFQHYSFEEKRQIISTGRPTPVLKDLTKKTKSYLRHFKKENYNKCEWLTGCDKKSVLFCWPCILFSTEKSLWNKSGFCDLNNLHKLIKRHSCSKAHIQAIIKEKTFGKIRIEHMLDNEQKLAVQKHNEEVRKNREILKRMIDVVCFLGKHELSFRGHSESGSSPNRGNYVDMIHFLSKYDEVLKHHLDNSTRFKGTSNLIQNDLILNVGEVILKKIKHEINEASFVAIILDETTDIANNSQLSKVVRYVTKQGEIKERFLGFFDVSMQRTALALNDIVQLIIDDLDCGSKLVGQSYDGAAVMAGHLGGLQAKVREAYPSALFIHCMAHRLNLVLQQSLNNIKQCKIFFQTLSGLAAFFSKSSKRSTALDQEVHKRLPRVAPTRWSYNGRLVETVFEYRLPLIDFFQKIVDNRQDWDNETVVCSTGYLNMLERETDFNLLLLIFSKIFPFCDNLFNVLQCKMNDINFCVRKIQEFKSIVLSKREHCDAFWQEFENLEILSNEPEIKRTRTADTVDNQKIDKKTQARKLFYEIIDNISAHIDDRFNNFKSLKFLELVDFKENTIISEEAFDSLKQNYPNFFDFLALRSELSVIYNTSEGLNKNSVSDLLKSIKKCGLDYACPETLKLCELTLTIPVTSTSAERSFSTLKRIKTFIRNSTGQERLSALAMISIEQELLQQLFDEPSFYDNVIDEFAKRSRRLDLHFK